MRRGYFRTAGHPATDVVQIYFPAGMKIITKDSFMNTAMECGIIPGGCTAIKANAFANNIQLRIVEMPSTVEFTDDEAFANWYDNLIIVTTNGSFAYGYAQGKTIEFSLAD